MLFVLVRVELHHVGSFAVGECLDTLTWAMLDQSFEEDTTLTSLGIPQLDLSIVTCTEELRSAVVKVDVFDGL